VPVITPRSGTNRIDSASILLTDSANPRS
jgi:hypothetical protein